ncbi:uncharacterized protein MONOS_17697 [Monocercomonoides exilis]|uniref:uncharacterized protein n=1 Tax=Monocercomonoides exilis TaxID=2049356 RepID=UPI0035594FEF|nr:hypothetical protein MONOS_17697 [Monocercomonoides exilis]
MSKPGLTPSKTLMQLQFMKKAAQKETMEKAKIEEEADSHWKLQDVSKGARVISLKGERSSNGHRSFGGFNSALEKQSFEPPKEIFKKQRGVSISDEEMALIYKPTKKTREDFQSPPPEEPKKSSRSSVIGNKNSKPKIYATERFTFTRKRKG